MLSRVWLLLLFPVTIWGAESSLTIYNDDFAVVRETIPLDLKEGINNVRYNDVTAYLEPASVILRDPTGKTELKVLSQDYRANPVTQEKMLSLFEGQNVDFQYEEDHKLKTVPGRVVRGGDAAAIQPQQGGGGLQPVIEVAGRLRFSLPGVPLFPKLGDDSILKPELSWRVSVAQPTKVDAEVAYLTKNLRWLADYNAVADEKGDTIDLVGWITIGNSSGKRFDNVKTSVVAGAVNKLERREDLVRRETGERTIVTGSNIPTAEAIPLDEYYLYSIPEPVTFGDQETRQVEFLRASGIPAKRIYAYYSSGMAPESLLATAEPQLDPGSDDDWQRSVAVMREFKNSEVAHLGVPLPKGRWRFYKRLGNRLEFTGENDANHTPKDETVRVFTGYTFDVVGEKKRLSYEADLERRVAEEGFEIKVRNQKAEPVEVRVVEYLLRWSSWEIAEKSLPFTKTGAHTIEFSLSLAPKEEKTLTYKTRYTHLKPPKAGPQ